MCQVRYAADKPKDCQYCYFWNRMKGCSLGKENCYYIFPAKEEKKPGSPCDGCSYARPHPCIGYCLRNIMTEMRQKGAVK